MVSIIERLNAKLESSAKSILIVPSDCFFTTTIEKPDGILREDVAEYVELSFETLTPFSIEQIAGGCLYHDESKRILVYGSYLPALRSRGIEQIEEFQHALPGFIAFPDAKYDQPTVAFVSFESSISALFFSTGDPVPEQVVSYRIVDYETNPSAISDARDKLRAELDMGEYHLDEYVWDGLDCIVEADGSVAIIVQKHPVGDQPEEAPTTITKTFKDEEILWLADVRSRSYKQKEANLRRLAKRIWFFLVAGVSVAALTLVLQFAQIAFSQWINVREERVAERALDVEEISNNNNLLNKIEQIALQELRPFDMLQSMNEIRPKSIHFTSVGSDEFNQLEVQGLGTTVAEVNRYGDALLRSEGIEEVQIDVRSRSGKAPFTLTVTFGEFLKRQELETEVAANTDFS